MGARIERPAYGLNDAPNRWWHISDKALRPYGCAPTRAYRFCCVVYAQDDGIFSGAIVHWHRKFRHDAKGDAERIQHITMRVHAQAMGHLVGPASGSPTRDTHVVGIVCIHVDDLFMSGNNEFQEMSLTPYDVISKLGMRTRMALFVGQFVRWHIDGTNGPFIRVCQDLRIDKLEDVPIGRAYHMPHHALHQFTHLTRVWQDRQSGYILVLQLQVAPRQHMETCEH